MVAARSAEPTEYTMEDDQDIWDSIIKPQIKRIVRDADLASVSIKSVVEELASLSELQDHQSLLTGDTIKDIIDDVLLERINAEDDERLARQLQEQESSSLKRRSTRTSATSTLASNKRARAPSSNASAKKSTKNGFNRLMVLSPQLSALLDGETMMSRPQVVKKIWEYVKLHNLQDPANKKVFLCDEKMEAVFKKKKVDCFQMNRFLSNHLSSSDEVTSAVASDSENDDNEVESEEMEASPLAFSLPRKVPLITPKLREMLQKCRPPPSLLPLVQDASKCIDYQSIQEACLEYLVKNNLIDLKGPFVVTIDAALKEIFADLEENSQISIIDYMERMRDHILSYNFPSDD